MRIENISLIFYMYFEMQILLCWSRKSKNRVHWITGGHMRTKIATSSLFAAEYVEPLRKDSRIENRIGNLNLAPVIAYEPDYVVKCCVSLKEAARSALGVKMWRTVQENSKPEIGKLIRNHAKRKL